MKKGGIQLKKYLSIVMCAFSLLLFTGCNDNAEEALDRYVPSEKESDFTDVRYNDDSPKKVDMMALDTNTPSNKYPHSKIIKKNVAIYKLNIGQGQKGQAPMGTTPQKREVAPDGGQAPTPAPSQKQEAPSKDQATPAKEQTTPAQGLSQFEQQVVDLTNAERKKNGLPPLTADTSLSQIARKKSDDMQANNYFSHNSPTYGSPFDMIRDFGVTYKTAGENIAKGQTTPQQVVNGWMNSEGHRKNILSSKFTHIGVGFNDGGKYWTQMFIGK
jgi:uncharacterized YkwD family protein